jgi:hypothetical protein
VDIAAGATLVVGGGTVFAATGGTGTGANAGKIAVADGATLELGGTFVNNGSITLGGSASATALEVDGTALTLSGGGRVVLSDNSNNAIVADGSAATLTNVNDTIAGGGAIGDADLTLVNQAGGIIDGDGVGNALKLIAATSNSGVLEATTSQGLIIAGDVDNTKTIEAAGKNAAVAITSTTISDGAAGLILASGSGAHVELDDATISGGKLETSGTGALIETVSGSTDNVIGGGTIVAGSLVEVLSGTALTLSGGTIGAGATVETASSGTLTVSGSITNSGTLFASGAGSMVDVAGVVSGGGTVKVGNGVVDIQGAGSESVAFMSGGTGGLQLDDASAYTGKITGFGADTTQFIDFTGINSAGATVSYAPNSSHPTSGGVLTVSSGGHMVASIAMVGKYTTANFLLGSDSGGHLEITDPPGAAPQPGGTPWLAGDGQGANVALLANYMAASFIAAAGGHDGTSIADAPQAASPPLLLAQPHTG